MKFAPTTLLLFAASTVAVSPSTGCGSAPKVITTNATKALTLQVGNAPRTFYVRLPPGYNSSTPHRLIFGFHGSGGSGLEISQGLPNAQGLRMYLPNLGLAAQSANDSIPTVFIMPDGSGTVKGWPNQGGEDVNFFRAMSALASSDLCIDENLRFALGFSYGGGLVNALSCALPEGHLRAIGFLSGEGSLSGGCVESGARNSMGLYVQHGVTDRAIPIARARIVRDRFLANNKCTAENAPEPAVGSGIHIKTEYKGCTKPVTWIAFDGGVNGGHTTVVQDKGAKSTWSDVESWNFNKQFR